MPKAKGDIYTFKFRLQPRTTHEARRIALFIKDALRQHGLKLLNLKKESENGEGHIVDGSGARLPIDSGKPKSTRAKKLAHDTMAVPSLPRRHGSGLSDHVEPSRSE